MNTTPTFWRIAEHSIPPHEAPTYRSYKQSMAQTSETEETGSKAASQSFLERTVKSNSTINFMQRGNEDHPQ